FEPFFLLFAGADQLEQVHVAIVGRHAIESEWPENRTRGLFVNRCPGNDRQIHAAIFLRRLWRPQVGLFCLLAHLCEPRLWNVLVFGEIFPIRSEERRVGKECRYWWWSDY